MRHVVTDAALADLNEFHAYIWSDSPNAADRLLVAAAETFRFLAEFPRAGRARGSRRSKLRHIRYFAIRGFPNHVAFYRLIDDGIEVVRVLHSARDIDRVHRREVI